MVTTPSEQLHQDGAEGLPLAWSLAGCGVMGLVKILFSVVTIQVNKLSKSICYLNCPAHSCVAPFM